MKTMKYMSQMLVASLLIALAACSDESEGTETDANTSKPEAYASIAISLPAGTTATRAASAEDSENSAEGTADEAKVHKATLYFFAATGETDAGKLITKVTIEKFSKKVTADNSIVYTSIPTALKLGKYNVYAIANGDATVVENGSGTATTEAAFKEFKFATSGENGTLTNQTGSSIDISTNGILMTSRSSTGVICQNNVEIKAEHTATNPCPITLNMERALAKISYTPAGNNNTSNTDNKFDIVEPSNSTTIATVQLTNYEVINVRKDCYAFRHVGTNSTVAADDAKFGAIDATNTYVIDPQTLAKTYTSGMASNYTNWYDNVSASSFSNTLPTGGSISTLAYCMENTMLKGSQKQGYTTGVVFKGKITPNNYINSSGNSDTYSSGDLYYYNGTFYADLTQLNAKNSFSATITDANKDDYGVNKYTDGACYYFYWIKHFPDASSSAMGIMEYAIVRNNDYQVKVTAINGLGQEAATYTATDDDKKSTVYIQVELTIRPWTVRKNDAVLG